MLPKRATIQKTLPTVKKAQETRLLHGRHFHLFSCGVYSVPGSQSAVPESKPLGIPEGVSSDDQELVMKLLTNPKALELLKGLANVI